MNTNKAQNSLYSKEYGGKGVNKTPLKTAKKALNKATQYLNEIGKIKPTISKEHVKCTRDEYADMTVLIGVAIDKIEVANNLIAARKENKNDR